MIATTRRVARSAWREGKLSHNERIIPEEAPVALTYNGTTHAVMLATPSDLEDFAIGFSLSERIISSPDQIEKLDIVEEAIGIDIQMWLAQPRAAAFTERRRFLAGATGCGLCGIESLAEATRSPQHVSNGKTFSPDDIIEAMRLLSPLQELNQKTAAVHAAAYWHPRDGIVALREDVGRHNALDKLSGTLAQANLAASDGILLLTSRVSVEMIQKAAAMDAPIVAAVSAPTALAVKTAEAAGITLIAVARGDGFEIFTNRQRVTVESVSNVV